MPAGSIHLLILIGLIVISSAFFCCHRYIVYFYISSLGPPYADFDIVQLGNGSRHYQGAAYFAPRRRFKITLCPLQARHTHGALEVAVTGQLHSHSHSVPRAILAVIRRSAVLCNFSAVEGVVIVGVHDGAALGYGDGIQCHFAVHPPKLYLGLFFGACCYHQFTDHSAAVAVIVGASVCAVYIIDAYAAIVDIVGIQFYPDGNDVPVLKFAVVGGHEGVGIVLAGGSIEQSPDFLVLITPFLYLYVNVQYAYGGAANIPDAQLYRVDYR